MVGAIVVTLVGLLLERVLRLLDLLSVSSNRFGFVGELALHLVPHYLGLTLPAAFFIALFVVIARLNQDSEVDALLASGVSLTRMVAPYVGLGLVLMCVSLVVFGYLQPYSRYAYRAVLHAAQNAGWSGALQEQMIVSPDPDLTITVDAADPAGRSLGGVFIRRIGPDGREDVTTARAGRLSADQAAGVATLVLADGQQLRTNRRDEPELLSFESFTLELPLSGATRLLRARGGDERELTLTELLREAGRPDTVIPRQTLLAEFLGRVARALALPLLPLLALPLGLAAKRGGRAPGIVLAGLLLLGFHHLLQFGESLAMSGRSPAVLSVGAPFVAFALIALVTFGTSCKRPGETPLALATGHASDAARRLARLGRRRAAA